MRSVFAILRLPCRLLQIPRDESGLHGIEDRAVKEEGIPLAPLGVSRDFSAVDGEIAGPNKVSTWLPSVQCRRHPFEDKLIGAADFFQLRMQRQRQHEGIRETAGSLQDGPAAARAPKHRDSIGFARVDMDVVHDPAGRTQHDKVTAALPKSQDRITADIIQFVEQGFVQSKIFYGRGKGQIEQAECTHGVTASTSWT